jgi:hypothetical protein
MREDAQALKKDAKELKDRTWWDYRKRCVIAWILSVVCVLVVVLIVLLVLKII